MGIEDGGVVDTGAERRTLRLEQSGHTGSVVRFMTSPSSVAHNLVDEALAYKGKSP